MMSAKEALDLTSLTYGLNLHNVLNKIDSDVYTACMQGKFKIVFIKTLTEKNFYYIRKNVVSSLCSKGFTVKDNSQTLKYQLDLEISWND